MLTSIKVFTGNTITAGQPVGITLNKVQGVLEKGVKYSLQFKVINYSSINTLDYIYVGTQKISSIDISQGTVIDTVDGKEVRLCSVEFTASSKVTNPVIKIGRNMVSSDTSNTLMYELTDFQLERGYKTDYSPNSNDLQIVKTDLESKINQLADSLQFYVAKNDFDNLGNTVSSALGQIEVSTGEISLKVEQTDIDNAKNELEGSIDKKISNAKAEIKMTTDSISQRVSSTESTTSTLSNKVTVVEGTANTAKSTADNANTLATTANNTANTNKNNIATLQSTVTTTNNKVAELTTSLDSITQRVQSTESSIQNTNNMLSEVSTGVNKVLFEIYGKTGQDGTEIVTIDDYLDATLLHTLLLDDFQMFGGMDYYLGKMTTHLYFNENVTHTVQAFADDGSSLYLNGTLVASMPTCSETQVTLNFKAGWNKIVWVYNEGNGGDGCRFTPSIKTLPGLVYMNAYPVSGDIEQLQAINSTVKTTKNKVAEIVTNLDSITQRVSSNETATMNTQTQLNNLQIGGTNTFSLENFNVSDINYWEENQVICNKTNRGFDVETHQGRLHLRFFHVIKENGYWTVSFKYKSSSPIDPIYVDICDKGVGQLSSTTDWKTFEGTVYVDNYGQGEVFNFVDIEQHTNVGGYVKYEFKDVKVEKGNKATQWSANPNDVQQQIDNTNTEITTTNNRVAEIVTNLDSITSRVSSTESTVTNTQQQLDNLNTDLRTNYSTTHEMNSAIEQKANQITQSVSQSYATKDEVNTIGVGGTNLLLHSSDYGDTSIWIRDGAWVESYKYRGTCVYTTDRAWADMGYAVNDLYDRGVIEPNTKYTFSCYVRSSNEAYQPNIHFFGHDNHSEQGAYIATVSTTWKRISVTFQWYDFSIRDYPIRFEATTGTPQSGCYLEWAGFKLEKGTKATDWTPAPEDSTESENKWLFEKYASDLAVNSSTSAYPTFDDIKPGCLLSSELIDYMTYQGDYGSTYLGKLTASFYFEADSTQTLTCATDDNSSWYLNGQLVDTAYSCQPKQITFYFKKGWNKLTVLYLEGHGGDGVSIDGLSGYTRMNAYNMGNIDEYGIYLNNKLISNYATKSEVTQTATDLTVKFTESGGYNLIHNGHAYRDPQGNIPYWRNNGGSEFNILGDARGGVRGNYFSLSMPQGMIYNDWIELKGNTHYVYQAQVWTGSPFTGNNNVPLHYWFSSNKSDIDKNGSVEFLDYNTTVSYAHTWTQIYIHFRTTEDVYMKPFVYGIDSSISPFYITEIMLSESRVVQRYASNSEEIYDGITKIDKNGITVTQSNAKTKTTMSADGFAITRTDKNADIFRVGSNGLLTLNGVFKCYKDDANMSGARLEASGAIMSGYNSTGGSNPVFASGLWTDENMGYFSVGYTNALTTDANGCLWMSPQHGNTGCRLTFSRLVNSTMLSTNLYFQKDGAIDFSTNLRGLNDTDDNYTYRFDSGVSTKALRCNNLRTHNIYPRNSGSHDIGSASMRYKDVFADSLSTTNTQLRLGTVTSSGAWQTYGALDINSRDGYVYPDKGTGQLSLGTSGARFHTIYLVNSPNVSSDERLKTDIHYLDEPMPKEPTIIDGRVERNMKITTKDMYDFVKDDLKLASYRYNVNLERGITTTDYGFIAQDVLYTKVGSELIQIDDKNDSDSTLSYNQGNYIATLAGALQEAINKIEVLEKKVQELESKLV